MTDQNIVARIAAYNKARRTDAEQQASQDLVNAVIASPEAITRDVFDACFWALSFLKKAVKPVRNDGGTVSGDKTEFTNYARNIVKLTERLKEIPPPGNKLTPSQIGVYLWALYAVAIGANDSEEVVNTAQKYIRMYDRRMASGWTPEEVDEGARRRMECLCAPNHELVARARAAADAGRIEQGILLYHEAMSAGTLPLNDAVDYCWRMVKCIWANPPVGLDVVKIMSDDFLVLGMNDLLRAYDRATEIKHRFFVGFAKRLKTAAKSASGGNINLPYEVAKGYVEMAEKFGFAALTQGDFQRRPVTSEQRAGMERKAGKKIRLKEWPSNVDEAVGVAAQCVKLYQNSAMPLKPGERMMQFLLRHIDSNEWFGFYYARWLKVCGRDAESIRYLVEVVKRKKNDDWAWQYLGDSFVAEPEKARACYCRSLTCQVHDKEIADGVAKKTHRKLAVVLRATGQMVESALEEGLAASNEPLPGNRTFYLQYAPDARRLMYVGEKTLDFTGRFEKHQDKAFGFVRIVSGAGFGLSAGKQISVFVPPPLAKALENGTSVKGFAAQRMDEKKKRLSWTAEEIEEAAT